MNTTITTLRHWLCCLFLAVPALALAATPAARTYQVQTGDTLDKVIRKTMPDSPLKFEILRNAFVQQNPQAFTKAPPRALMAGVVLNVPNHDDLLRRHLGSRIAPVEVAPAPPRVVPSTIEERKRWVQFP